jgi:hypothetical protein
MLLLRVLARLAGIALMILLALVGLGVALFCLDGFIRLGSARPDRLLHLPVVRDHVGRFLHQVAAPGSTAGLALLCGAGALVLGVLLLAGLLVPRRQRLVYLERDADEGTLAARPTPLREMVGALVASTPGATSVARPRLRKGGRLRPPDLRVVASRSRAHEPRHLEHEIDQRLEPLTTAFGMRTHVRVRTADPGSRVQ